MNRAVGLQAVGGVLVLVGLIWGWTGFYARNVPWLLLLLLGGAGLLFAGIKLKDLENRR
ncbi:MAG: hypothetical protein J0I40_01055 [Cellulomonas sp.]|uniref:hypothetical protein n=1 Tax=Cellulomonas sp. 73-92 TaxID=1895740 RepID=UPI001AD15CDA|nr:hypothetical protein [Cellulomonas sp. 73-92]MBN9373982.1 hypothetical protein [Cellulomonas sp.]